MYDFLTSYKSFDYEQRFNNGIFLYCKFNTCEILKDLNLLEFTMKGDVNPYCKLDVCLDNLLSVTKKEINQRLDIITLICSDIPKIILYSHK